MLPIIAKMLSPLITPLGWCLALWVVGLFMYVRRRRDLGQVCVLLGVVLILIFGSPWMGNALLGGLENQFEIHSAIESPTADAIVVLGGVTIPPVAPRVEVEIEGGGDRLPAGIPDAR